MSESDRPLVPLPDEGPTVCAECGTATWLVMHCGSPVVAGTVHFARESSAKPLSWRLICGESMRCDDFRTTYPPEVNCERCRAILDREAKAAA